MTEKVPALLKYEAARQALTELHRVDEVKNFRDKAVAMQIYATQAKDRTLIDQATEIRLRAEIRAGELLTAMKVRGERAKPGDAGGGTDGRGVRLSVNPTLVDLKLTKTQASRWQKLAALTPEEQQHKIETAKQKAQAAVDPPRREKSDRAPRLGTGVDFIPAIDRCVATVTNMISICAQEIEPAERRRLFDDVRANLDHLEAHFGETTNNGYHAARQSA